MPRKRADEMESSEPPGHALLTGSKCLEAPPSWPAKAGKCRAADDKEKKIPMQSLLDRQNEYGNSDFGDVITCEYYRKAGR